MTTRQVAEFRWPRWLGRRKHVFVGHFDACFGKVLRHGARNADDQEANLATPDRVAGLGRAESHNPAVLCCRDGKRPLQDVKPLAELVPVGGRSAAGICPHGDGIHRVARRASLEEIGDVVASLDNANRSISRRVRTIGSGSVFGSTIRIFSSARRFDQTGSERHPGGKCRYSLTHAGSASSFREAGLP
jgi:hypothetical protein